MMNNLPEPIVVDLRIVCTDPELITYPELELHCSVCHSADHWADSVSGLDCYRCGTMHVITDALAEQLDALETS